MTLLFLLLVALGAPASQQPENLVRNGDARYGLENWLPQGDARIEGSGDAAQFVVRNKGSFRQTIPLPATAPGQYLVVIGRGASDRVNADGSITGLPSLYGLVGESTGRRFVAYLTGQQMLARPVRPGEWAFMYGIFRVPEDAVQVFLSLNQAERKDDPQNGSAARFDDVGLYLFANELEARTFVAARIEPRQATAAQRKPTRAELDVTVGPPVDPSLVTPFDPQRLVVLPAEEGHKAERQCSRRSPGRVADVFVPTDEEVQRIEQALPPLLAGALERSANGRPIRLSPRDYYRQYTGLVIGGRRIVYVNGMARLLGSAELVQWRTTFLSACDGGTLFFGAEYDTTDRRFIVVAFNGVG